MLAEDQGTGIQSNCDGSEAQRLATPVLMFKGVQIISSRRTYTREDPGLVGTYRLSRCPRTRRSQGFHVLGVSVVQSSKDMVEKGSVCARKMSPTNPGTEVSGELTRYC